MGRRKEKDDDDDDEKEVYARRETQWKTPTLSNDTDEGERRPDTRELLVSARGGTHKAADLVVP